MEKNRTQQRHSSERLSGELLQAHTARVCVKELLQNGTTLHRCRPQRPLQLQQTQQKQWWR